MIEVAEVGDEVQVVRPCHGGHLSTGEDRLDAQLLLCYVQHSLVGPNGIPGVHRVKVPVGRRGCHQGGLCRVEGSRGSQALTPGPGGSGG